VILFQKGKACDLDFGSFQKKKIKMKFLRKSYKLRKKIILNKGGNINEMSRCVTVQFSILSY
jgi:hypothetical protein